MKNFFQFAATLLQNFLALLTGAIIVFVPFLLSGQTDRALLRELAAENQQAVEALALYPSETRLAILEATKYPEILIKMNNARQKTAAAFRTLIEDFPQDAQNVWYDLPRYPGLLQQVANHLNDQDGLKNDVMVFPEKQRPYIAIILYNNPRTVLKINDLLNTSQAAFSDMIAPYPTPARAAFQQLVELPEVLEILNDDLRFTVLVGDMYKENPVWVIRQTDSLNLVVARTQAQELDDWKKDIAQDPQARQEFKDASREYAAAYGYDWDGYYEDDLYYDQVTTQPNIVVAYHYPWWFGYPWWYDYPYWRPYPWWYEWGFYPYYTNIVIVYMPSPHFMHWYFDHPHHHSHYPHLSSGFVQHYYRYRHTGTSISETVGRWHEQNKTVFPGEWMNDRSRLPQRMKEYGTFEASRTEHNLRNSKNPETPEVYLNKNSHKYPQLEQGRSVIQQEKKLQPERTPERPSAWAPDKEPAIVPPALKKPVEKATQPKAPARKPEQPPANRPERPSIQKDRPVEQAKDYHKEIWDQRKRDVSTPKAAPRTPGARQPASKAPAPKSPPKGRTDMHS